MASFYALQCTKGRKKKRLFLYLLVLTKVHYKGRLLLQNSLVCIWMGFCKNIKIVIDDKNYLSNL